MRTASSTLPAPSAVTLPVSSGCCQRRGDEALGGEVVDLVRLVASAGCGSGCERSVRLPSISSTSSRMPSQRSRSPITSEAGAAAHQPDHAVALAEQELRQVGAVLAGDAGDQGCGHVAPDGCAVRLRRCVKPARLPVHPRAAKRPPQPEGGPDEVWSGFDRRSLRLLRAEPGGRDAVAGAARRGAEGGRYIDVGAADPDRAQRDPRLLRPRLARGGRRAAAGRGRRAAPRPARRRGGRGGGGANPARGRSIAWCTRRRPACPPSTSRWRGGRTGGAASSRSRCRSPRWPRSAGSMRRDRCSSSRSTSRAPRRRCCAGADFAAVPALDRAGRGDRAARIRRGRPAGEAGLLRGRATAPYGSTG